jgi:hypothetical protein
VPHHRELFMRILLLLLVLTGCSGCNENAGGGAGAASKEQVSPRVEVQPELPVGESDTGNRYASAVIVFTPASGAEEKGQLCSGVLMDSRLVLTAGHCVCKKRVVSTPGGEDRTRIDGSTCAKSATITTVTYKPPTSTRGVGSRTQDYTGQVLPHPALKVLLDAQGNVLSSEADLAVIVLETPIEGPFPFVELADTEVQVGESLVIVAYGFDERLGTLGGKRRFRASPVTKILDSGRVLFEQPDRQLYRGDSGGPCLRETRNGVVLVGILSRALGQEASFTSTYASRAWLREEIQRAVKAGSASPPDSP